MVSVAELISDLEFYVFVFFYTGALYLCLHHFKVLLCISLLGLCIVLLSMLLGFKLMKFKFFSHSIK